MTGQALSIVQGSQPTVVALEIRSMEEAMLLSRVMAASGVFKDTRDANAACAKILIGAEVGIPPATSLKNIYIIDGKPAFSYQIIAAMVKRSGKYDFDVLERSDTACKIQFHRKSRSSGQWEEAGPVIEFTMKEAIAAGITGKDVWRKFPKNMLLARAMTNGVNTYCSDIFLGSVYTPEELGANVNAENELIQEPKPTARVTETTQESAPEAQETAPESPETEEEKLITQRLRDRYIEEIKARNKNRKSAGKELITVTPGLLGQMLHLAEADAKAYFFSDKGNFIIGQTTREDILRMWHVLLCKGEIAPRDADLPAQMADAIERICNGDKLTTLYAKDEPTAATPPVALYAASDAPADAGDPFLDGSEAPEEAEL